MAAVMVVLDRLLGRIVQKKRDNEEDWRGYVPASIARILSPPWGTRNHTKKEREANRGVGERESRGERHPTPISLLHAQPGALDSPRTPRPSACPSSRTRRPCPRGRGAAPRACSTPTRSCRCSPSDGTEQNDTPPSASQEGAREAEQEVNEKKEAGSGFCYVQRRATFGHLTGGDGSAIWSRNFPRRRTRTCATVWSFLGLLCSSCVVDKHSWPTCTRLAYTCTEGQSQNTAKW